MKNIFLNTAIIIACMLGANSLPAQLTNVEWVIPIGSGAQDRSNSVTVDESGNVYAAGRFSGTADFDNSSNTNVLTSNGNSDIFICKYSASGNLIWARSLGGDSLDAATGIVIDNNGNVIVTGFYNKTVDFDPGTGTSYLSSSIQSAYVLKLENDGDFIWAGAIKGSSWCTISANALIVDSSNNILIAGYYHGTLDADPGTDTKYLTSNGYGDAFVIKLNASGGYIWACSFGGTDDGDGISSIAVDNSSNVYLTGYFKNTVDFDPSGNTYNLTSENVDDAFILKLNVSGEFVFAKSISGPNTVASFDIALDNSGNILIAGAFIGKVDFDPGAGTFYLTASGQDAFIAKYNAFGNFIWAKNIGGTSSDIIRSICLDESDNLYCAGGFMGKVDMDPGTGEHYLMSAGNWDAFVGKMNSSGNLIWVKQIGGDSFDFSPSLCIDDVDNIYSTGWFSNKANFDLNYSNVSKQSTGNEDAYIHKISQSTCNTRLINVSVSLDNYGSENSWQILNSSNQVVSSGGPYLNGPIGVNVSQNICLPNGCYTFVMSDAAGNGMCCTNGKGGNYIVTNVDLSSTIASGSRFKSSQSHAFCLTSSCAKASNIASSNISGNSATASWNAASNATSYNVRIRLQNSTWSSFNTSSTSYTFNGLNTCTNYEFEVETVCSSGSSGYSSTYGFKTTGCSNTCDAPSGLYVSNINKKNARLNWDVVSGATSYEVSYWAQGSSTVKTIATTSNLVNLTGLNISTIYEWKVKVYCTSVWSSFSTTAVFEAGNSGSGPAPQQGDQTLSDYNISYPDIVFNLSIFPNPTAGNMIIKYESLNSPATHIQIVDLQGRVVMYIKNEMGSAIFEEIDLNHLAVGMYLVQVYSQNNLITTKKISKTD